jgi:uncharacterized protein (DUF4213/DUF364 family)
MSGGALQRVQEQFQKLAESASLLEMEVSVMVKPLTPEEAIGAPKRQDFPIIIGKERVIEALVAGSRGHAFSDTVRNFEGKLGEVLVLPLDNNDNRAIFIAVLNATLHHLGHLDKTLHCRDDDPELCGADIAQVLRERFGRPHVGLIGLNPAIVEHLVEAFGAENVHITDMNADNIGGSKYGVDIWDGSSQTDELIRVSDVILITGTTLVNGTFDEIWNRINVRGKTGIVFGVTAAGVCSLMKYERLCPYARGK